MKPVPEIGERFGRWTVIDNNQKTKRNARASLCKCDCGKIEIVSNSDLRTGHSKSCGCFRSTAGIKRSTHNSQGYSGTRIYKIWNHMRERCYSPKHPYYERYGGNGITICDEWKNDFMSFREWALANGYREDLSIDRIDNDKGYCPDNCRWSTNEEQQNNTRWNLNMTLNGKTQSLSRWSRELNIPTSTIYSRLERGWDVESALTSPRYKHNSKRKDDSICQN